jgi:hypothetical protein
MNHTHTGHDNAYVRSSVAAAIAEAVELLPQTTETTISTLCEYYREKVCWLRVDNDRISLRIFIG